jgi:hypothetical protein
VSEIDRLVQLAESDLVQDMESDPVEPELELEFIGGFSDGVRHLPPTRVEESDD